MTETATIDLGVLRDLLRAAMPNLVLKMVELEHSETRVRYPALSMEVNERERNHAYRITVTVMDGKVHFFAHVHGAGSDVTTRNAQHYSKDCADVDEVFAILHACWTGGRSS